MAKRSRSRVACATPDKKAFPSVQRAKVGARDLARHTIASGHLTDAIYGYPCSCGSWHLTHHPEWDGKPMTLLYTAPPPAMQRWAIDG